MELTGNGGLQSELALAIFALYVVGISLCRLLAEKEFPRLTSMKKAWGRSRGLLMHFLVNVGLPMVCAVVFMARGVVGLGTNAPYDPIPQLHVYHHLAQGSDSVAPGSRQQDPSSQVVEEEYRIGAPCP